MKGLVELVESIFDDQTDAAISAGFIKEFNGGEFGNRGCIALSLVDDTLNVRARKTLSTIIDNSEIKKWVNLIHSDGTFTVNKETILNIPICSAKFTITEPTRAKLCMDDSTNSSAFVQVKALKKSLTIKNLKRAYVYCNDSSLNLNQLFNSLKNLHSDTSFTVEAGEFYLLNDPKCARVRDLVKQYPGGRIVLDNGPELPLPNMENIPPEVEKIVFDSESGGPGKYLGVHLSRKPFDKPRVDGGITWSKPLTNGWYLRLYNRR